jgi:KDO2-lipid IV(A) lauroyltransferase
LWQRFVLSAFVRTANGVQRMSRPAALHLGSRLGRLAYRVDGRRRGYAERNLRLAYGDSLSPAERNALTRRTFEHWGKSTVEFLRAPCLGTHGIAALVSAIEGREYLEEVRSAGTGFIFVTGHLGNFEFLGRWLASQGIPSTVIARAPADPAFAAYLRGMREYNGNVTLPKGTSVRELLAVLKRKEVLTLGVDQNSGDLFLPFFGVPAGTVAGPALLALRTGVPLLPAFCVSEPDDTYRILFLKPLRPESTGNKDADIARTMAEVNAILETVVRQYPEQWLWLHNRWKSAFEEKNRERWPEGYDFEAAHARWVQK